MKKILITGFEPFGGSPINPALEAVSRLEGLQLKGGTIITCSVPVVRNESIKTVIEAIKQHQPDVVITVGQAGGRMAVTPERIAINIDDYRIKDNAGNQPINESIIEGAPAAYFTTLPIKAMVADMQKQGIPALVSNSAGTFVCNHLFYGVQHYLADQNIRHGFIHIPYMPEQAVEGNQPTMQLEKIVDALTICAQSIIDNDEDIQSASGSEIC